MLWGFLSDQLIPLLIMLWHKRWVRIAVYILVWFAVSAIYTSRFLGHSPPSAIPGP